MGKGTGMYCDRSGLAVLGGTADTAGQGGRREEGEGRVVDLGRAGEEGPDGSDECGRAKGGGQRGKEGDREEEKVLFYQRASSLCIETEEGEIRTVNALHTSWRFMNSYETSLVTRDEMGTRRNLSIRISSEGYLQARISRAFVKSQRPPRQTNVLAIPQEPAPSRQLPSPCGVLKPYHSFPCFPPPVMRW